MFKHNITGPLFFCKCSFAPVKSYCLSLPLGFHLHGTAKQVANVAGSSQLNITILTATKDCLDPCRNMVVRALVKLYGSVLQLVQNDNYSKIKHPSKRKKLICPNYGCMITCDFYVYVLGDLYTI